MKTTSQSESQAKSAIDNARNLGSYFITLVKNMAGSKGDISRLKFIYSPDWEKGFAERARIADKSQRMKEISQYVTDTALKAGLGANQAKNLISMMDERD